MGNTRDSKRTRTKHRLQIVRAVPPTSGIFPGGMGNLLAAGRTMWNDENEMSPLSSDVLYERLARFDRYGGFDFFRMCDGA